MGGDDFDHRLTEKFISCLRDQHDIDPNADKVAQARLNLLAEQTKVRLSSETTVHLEEPIVVDSETYLLELTLTRDDFEQLIDDLVSSTIEKATQALTEAGVSPSSLSRLLLVGGSTRIPFISERLVSAFGLEPESWLDPDLSVAIGASVQGAIVNGEVFERSIVDICPHSLGIAALGEEDYQSEPGFLDGGFLDSDFLDSDYNHPLSFIPLIRRNSRLPAQFVRTFYKGHEQQKSVVIPVYQGESSNTRQNTFIGEFSVDMHNQHDNKLDISFAYDLNGTISISVEEAGHQQAKVYTMDLSRSADENSDLSGFTEQLLEHEENCAEDTPAVTNYLIEKVSQKLNNQSATTPTGMHDLLERYKSLLEQDDDDALDEVEDQLYSWIESE